MPKITETKIFEIPELNGSVSITYSYDQYTYRSRPLGDGTPEIVDYYTSDLRIDSVELDIMGVGFMITENIEKKLGTLKFNKLVDALENASE